jgi:hypothetical protein
VFKREHDQRLLTISTFVFGILVWLILIVAVSIMGLAACMYPIAYWDALEVLPGDDQWCFLSDCIVRHTFSHGWDA